MQRFFPTIPALLLALFVPVLTGATPPAAHNNGEPLIRLDSEALALLDPSRHFQLGIDRETDEGFRRLARRRVAAVVHPASVDSRGVPVLRHLLDAEEFTLVRVFHMEPRRRPVPDWWFDLLEEARESGLSVVPVTPDSFLPERGHLRDVNTVAWDVPLPGGRFELETAALGAMLEAASLAGVRYVLFDRPLLGDNAYLEGPLAEVGYLGSRQAFFPTLLYPGLTPGELAEFFNEQYSIQADLRVVHMRNWNRSDGNRWVRNPHSLRVGTEGKDVLRSLQSTGVGVPGFEELRALPAIAGEDLWESVRVSVSDDGRPEVRLVPREVPVVGMLERLEGRPLPGVETSVDSPRDGDGPAALLLRPAEDQRINPFEAGLRLRAVAVPSIRNHEPPEDHGVFGTGVAFDALSRGLDPRQARVRWVNTSAYRVHLDLRERYLVYPE